MYEAIVETFKTEFLSFIIGTLIIGTSFNAIGWFMKWVLDWKNRDWKLQVVPENNDRDEYSSLLLPEEIKNIRKSQLKSRQFIQSVCSSEDIRIRAGQIDTSAPNGWAYLDKKNKIFRINFKIIPDTTRKPDSKPKPKAN